MIRIEDEVVGSLYDQLRSIWDELHARGDNSMADRLQDVISTLDLGIMNGPGAQA